MDPMGTEISNMKGCLTYQRVGLVHPLISAGQLVSSASQPCRLPVLGGNFLSWFPLVNFICWKVRIDTPRLPCSFKSFLMASDTLSQHHTLHVWYILFTSIYHKDQPDVGKYFIHGSCGNLLDVFISSAVCSSTGHHLNLVRFVTFKYFGSLGISWSSDF